MDPSLRIQRARKIWTADAARIATPVPAASVINIRVLTP
jgi:hypothetical protein